MMRILLMRTDDGWTDCRHQELVNVSETRLLVSELWRQTWFHRS